MVDVAVRPSQENLSFTEKHRRLREATERYYRDEIDLDQYELEMDRYEPDYESMIGALSRLRTADEGGNQSLSHKSSRSTRIRNAFRALIGAS